MSDYKETNISGIAWQRAYQILILNPLGQMPTIRYDEESVITLGIDKQIKQPVSNLGYTIDPEAVIQLRDPISLELTDQTVSVALIYQALLSDYINRAIERDNPIIQTE